MSVVQAVLHKFDWRGNRQWSYQFDDWEYGVDCREEIESVDFDSVGNIYCFTHAWYDEGGEGGETYRYARVHKMTSSGGLLWTASSLLESPWSYSSPSSVISCAPSGFFVYNSQAEMIIARDNKGNALWSKTGLYGCYGVNVGEDGYIYIRDDDGVYKLDISGKEVWFSSIGGSSGA